MLGLLQPVGSNWMGGRGGESSVIPFCFSLKWRNGSALHGVFSRALALRKDSQSNLSGQKLDASPNTLDNSLSAVKTSPPSVIKTDLPSNAPLLPSRGSEETLCILELFWGGSFFFSLYSKHLSIFNVKIWQSNAFKTR